MLATDAEIEAEYSRLLGRPRPSSHAERFEAYGKAIRAGLMTVADARRMEGLPPSSDPYDSHRYVPPAQEGPP